MQGHRPLSVHVHYTSDATRTRGLRAGAITVPTLQGSCELVRVDRVTHDTTTTVRNASPETREPSLAHTQRQRPRGRAGRASKDIPVQGHSPEKRR